MSQQPRFGLIQQPIILRQQPINYIQVAPHLTHVVLKQQPIQPVIVQSRVRTFTPQKSIIQMPQKIYQPILTSPSPVKTSPIKKMCQQGYDHQEENRILKNYISQMEQTIQDLEVKKKMNKIQVPHKYSYKKLLEDQLEENIEIRGKIEELINDIQKLKEEGQYLKKLHQKQ